MTALHGLGNNETAARVSGHVKVSAIHHDDAQQFERTIEGLRAKLGSQLDQLRRESAAHTVNEVIDVAIAGLLSTGTDC